jgi:Flp pilus assembly pilin Flp
MARFVKDRRGAVAVQVALLLPILIIILMVAFEVWKVLSLQQVLNDAAYQGVRLMVMQANAAGEEPRQTNIPWQTERLIRRYVSRAAFVSPGLRSNPEDTGLLQVQMDYWPARCGNEITIEVQLYYVVGSQWRRPPSDGWLPFIGRAGRLTGRASGTVLCEREIDVTGG